MIRRVLMGLCAALVAAAAVVVPARLRMQRERAAAVERAESAVDEQATRVDALLDRFTQQIIRRLQGVCAELVLDPAARAIEDGARDAAEPYETLIVERCLTRDGRRGPATCVRLWHHCPGGDRRAMESAPIEELTDALAPIGRIVVEGDARAALPTSAIRQQEIRRGELGPHITTWSPVDAVPLEPSTRTWALAVVVALLVLALTLLAGGGGSRPDPKLEAAARRVGEGDLDVTLDGSSPTASAFNRMTRELKDARTRLARAERIAAWRDIARRIAHEIKNPLTPIKMAMETLRKTHARKHPDFDEIFEESTKTVLEETARLERIVTEFSRFARMPRPKAESIDVGEVVERVVSMHDLPAAAATLPEAAKGVRVEVERSADRLPSVRADREQLTQVLVNLVQNACDAAREKQGDTGGRVVVHLARTSDDGVRIVVADNGPGIPIESRIDVLEPYYTTKSHGTGLGLAIVDRIVSDHGGTVELGDDPELRGAAVTITLRREGPSDEPESSVGV